MPLAELLAAPPAGQPIDQRWFVAIARELLGRRALIAGRECLRILSVELYYSGPGHADPFAHGDPAQHSCGRWYLHRTGSGFRGGTYKGLDLTFGPPDAAGGILIRALLRDKQIIDGSALCADALLAATGHASVASLHAALEGRSALDSSCPLYLAAARWPERPVLATARVGLTLKRAARLPTMPAFLLRPYRFTTEPALARGRAHSIVALYRQGLAPQEIAAAAGSTRRAVERCLAAYRRGLAGGDFRGGTGAAVLCHNHGVWQRRFGDQKA